MHIQVRKCHYLIHWLPILYTAKGQTYTIGFGKLSDLAAEGEHNRFIRVTLSPGSLSGNIMGHIVPLTTEQFGSYTFNTSRTVPQGVQQAINDISDPAECE